jgi:hypothetical protein
MIGPAGRGTCDSSTPDDSVVVSYTRFREVRERRLRVMAALARRRPVAAPLPEAAPGVTAVAGVGQTPPDASCITAPNAW